MNKCQAVLIMYDKFLSGEKIYLNQIMNEFGISLPTFRRYISEINVFFFNAYKNQAIVYDYSLNCYYLSNR